MTDNALRRGLGQAKPLVYHRFHGARLQARRMSAWPAPGSRASGCAPWRTLTPTPRPVDFANASSRAHSGGQCYAGARPPETVAPHLGLTTVMSSVTREGEWVMPRLLRALTFMGEATIDLTQVRIAPGTSEIDARAFLGEIKDHRPPQSARRMHRPTAHGQLQSDALVRGGSRARRPSGAHHRCCVYGQRGGEGGGSQRATLGESLRVGAGCCRRVNQVKA